MADISISFGPLHILAIFALALAPVAVILCLAARAALGRRPAAWAAGLGAAIAILAVLEMGMSLGIPSIFGFGTGIRAGLAGAAVACWAVSAVLPGYWRRELDVAVLCGLALGGAGWLALS